MITESEEYKEHLENKYLPGRTKYLHWFFYPKIMRQFSSKPIVDLGCGTGEFLSYLSKKKREFSAIDNNPFLVEKCVKNGFKVKLDDVTTLATLGNMDNAVIDNVLEHLDLNQINAFFTSAKSKMNAGGILVVVVPDEKGYKYDPTHKTFVNTTIINQMCEKHGLKLINKFLHPFNLGFMGRILYLNMQVFTIKF